MQVSSDNHEISLAARQIGGARNREGGIGDAENRSIIQAIAYHGHHSAVLLQVMYSSHFLLRRLPAVNGCDAQ